MDEADFDGKPGQALSVPTFGELDGGRGRARRRGRARHADARRPAPRCGRGRASARPRWRRSRPRSSTSPTAPGSTAPRPRRRSPRASSLGAYQFLKYKGDQKASLLEDVVLAGRGGARLQAAVDRGAAVAGAVAWARDMVNEPSGAKSPAAFADAAPQAAARQDGHGEGARRARSSRRRRSAACSVSGRARRTRRAS